MSGEPIGSHEARQVRRPAYSLAAHLGAFAVVLLVPVLLLVAALLWRVVAAERDELERRVQQVAEDLADDLDRDLTRQFAVLRTLTASEPLTRGDFATFRMQALTAIGSEPMVISLIDPAMQ